MQKSAAWFYLKGAVFGAAVYGLIVVLLFEVLPGLGQAIADSLPPDDADLTLLSVISCIFIVLEFPFGLVALLFCGGKVDLTSQNTRTMLAGFALLDGASVGWITARLRLWLRDRRERKTAPTIVS